MEIQNEKEAFERFKAKQIGIDYETLKKDLDDCEKRFPNNRYAGWNFKSDWELWQAATALAVPDGFFWCQLKKSKLGIWMIVKAFTAKTLNGFAIYQLVKL